MSSLQVSLATAASAALGIVVGMCLTVGWTVASSRPAVPALPLALALGMAGYFAGRSGFPLEAKE